MAHEQDFSTPHQACGTSRRRILGAGSALAAAWALAPAGALAQSKWPAKPVTLVVPFPAGGGTDAFARPMSAQFAKLTGTQLVIDNRGGAGGTLGAGIAAKAAPDGYTLFMGAVHHAIAPSMYPKLDYDIEKDFIPLALVANVPQVLVVNPKNVQGDFKAFLAQVKANPGKLNYGSAGGGTSHHLAGELFKQQTGTFITHIPYRGSGPALNDAVAGQVEMIFDNLPSALPFIQAGKLIPIAVAAPKRLEQLPNVPTFKEVGLEPVNRMAFFGIIGPKGLPKEVVDKVNAGVRKSLEDPAVRKRIEGTGSLIVANTPEQFAEQIKAEFEIYKQLVNSRKLKLD